MFPPTSSKPQPKAPAGPPQGNDLMAMLSGGGQGGPPPMAGPQPMGLPPGMPKPGSGMDPMAAMQNGLGLIPPPPDPSPSGVMGDGGMPVGGSMPGDCPGCDEPDMGGSDLLSALSGSLGGDPYDQPPGMNPMMGGGGQPGGLDQLLEMLAMTQMGVGPQGGPPPGGMGGMGMGGPY